MQHYFVHHFAAQPTFLHKSGHIALKVSSHAHQGLTGEVLLACPSYFPKTVETRTPCMHVESREYTYFELCMNRM